MKKRPRFLLVLVSLVVLALLAGGITYQALFSDLPEPESIQTRLNLPSVRILDRNGRLLYEALGEDGGRHTVVPLESIPLTLRQATLATEDKSFYSNPGVDLRGILRAMWINLRGGETLAGGSTITQQVARDLLMDAGERNERSLRRKLRETFLAWRLTRHFQKDEILALYLNQTYYGGMSYGVEAAAQTFFGKPASKLDLAESALLAGLPQAPARYNPFTDLKSAKQRQSVVLSLMQSQGMITAEQRSLAEREPLVLASTPFPILAPHFVMLVRAQLDSLFTPQEIYKAGGLEVRTSLDLDWQQIGERAIQRQIQALQHSEDGLGHNVNNAALVALDPQTGDILAMVGSPDYFDTKHAGAINMAISPRQPGSALKPLVYATALDPNQAQPWTAATMLLDVRTSFVTHEGESYTPSNYDQKEHGPVLVRQALASSLNIPAVLTLDHIGLKALFEQAGKMGISTLGNPDDHDLSLALGGGEVRLIDLTAAYGAFANTGYRVDPRAILEVRDLQGNHLYRAPAPAHVRVVDERVAWLISDILNDNQARLLGFGPNTILRVGRPAAVKTGTTSNFHDNWTVGYTPGLVVGVWAGNTSYEPMRDVNGLTGAAPIWHEFLRAVLAGQPEQPFVRPPGLVQVEVCALSGLLPGDVCPYRRMEWFIEGTQPTESDTFYRSVMIDAANGRLAGSNTPPERQRRLIALDLPPQARPWARQQGLTLLSDLQVAAPAAGSAALISQEAPLRLVAPAPSSVYRLAQGFDSAAQKLRLEAVGESGISEVTLWLDDAPLATLTKPPFETWWPLTAGEHQAWAEARLGDGSRLESQRVQFQVLP